MNEDRSVLDIASAMHAVSAIHSVHIEYANRNRTSVRYVRG
jgi:hypothetical protein